MGKNNQEMDKELMEIKNHLDTSFDYDNIVVTEELIRKTLRAVKESEQEKIIKKPLFSWKYGKQMGAVAAMVILFVAGAYAVNYNSGLGHRKNADIGYNLTGNQENKAESLERPTLEMEEGYTASDDADMKIEDQNAGLLADTEGGKGFEADGIKEESIEESENQNQMSTMDSAELKLNSTFAAFYSIDRDDITKVQIEVGGITKESEKEEVISQVIQLLNEYTLAEETETEIRIIVTQKADSKETEPEPYKIHIFTGVDESFKITVSDKIQVEETEASYADESHTEGSYKNYTTAEIDRLRIRIEELIHSMP